MERVYAAVFAALGWFAVVGQYVVSAEHTVAGTIDYLSYFTILSNILVALTFTAAAFARNSSLGRFLLRPSVALATAIYITVTGITYYLLLAALYTLHGWEQTFDHLLHYVVPPGFVLFWLVFIPKGTLHFRNVLWALVPPLGYGAWTLLHGAVSGFYPYPFVDVSKLGYPQVFVHIIEFVFFFSLVGVIYTLIDRIVARFGLQSKAG